MLAGINGEGVERVGRQHVFLLWEAAESIVLPTKCAKNDACEERNGNLPKGLPRRCAIQHRRLAAIGWT
jgi:hypothetical protein